MIQMTKLLRSNSWSVKIMIRHIRLFKDVPLKICSKVGIQRFRNHQVHDLNNRIAPAVPRDKKGWPSIRENKVKRNLELWKKKQLEEADAQEQLLQAKEQQKLSKVNTISQS